MSIKKIFNDDIWEEVQDMIEEKIAIEGPHED